MSKEDIEKAVKNAEAYAEEDKKRREQVETKNNAESLVFQCEKAMTDFGDKVSADDKAPVQSKIDALKEALKTDNYSDISAKKDELEKSFQELATKVYQQAGAAANAAGASPDMNGFNDTKSDSSNDDDVIDANFTEA
jgi:molecular chaperone DnaK